jgi:V/A-type H+-transporting ATPase subunit C
MVVLASFSNKAIMTKAKAMYSKHLRTDQYRELMRRQSVSDIAAYLRDETQYGDVLNEINPSAIHRGQLENLLRESRFLQYGKLMRYNASSAKANYYHYFIAEIEVEQILRMVRLLNMGTPEQYVLQYPRFVERYINFRMDKMAKARNFDEMLEVLSGTPYERQLAGLRPRPKELIDYTRCETTLYNHYYTEIEETIRRYFHGKTRAQLNALFQTQVEVTNIRNIYRLKKYFPGADQEFFQKSLVSAWRRVPSADMENLAAAGDVDSFFTALNRSRYAKYFKPDDFRFIEYRVKNIRYQSAKRYLHFADDAPVAFTAYMILCELELGNIVSIIEGVRYNVDPEEIEKFLILSNG